MITAPAAARGWNLRGRPNVPYPTRNPDRLLLVTLVYFGPWWDSPILDGTIQVGTPVGRPCLGCGELIVRGDRGTIETAAAVKRAGVAAAETTTMMHAECRLDEVAGHMIGLCVCRAIVKTRERAVQVWSHFHDEQGNSRWPRMTTR